MEAVKGFASKLRPDQAAAEAREVFDAIKATTHPGELRALGEKLTFLAPELMPQDAAATLEELLRAIQLKPVPVDPGALVVAVGALAPKITPDKAPAALDKILEMIRNTTYPVQLRMLAGAVRLLPVQLNSDQAADVLNQALKIIQYSTSKASPTSTSAVPLSELIEVINGLPVQLTNEQATSVVDAFLKIIRTVTLPRDFNALTQPVQTFASKLLPDQTPNVIASLCDVIQEQIQAIRINGDNTYTRLKTYIDVLRSLPLQPSFQQTKYIFDQLLEAILATNNDPGELIVLMETLNTLHFQFSDAQAVAVVNHLLGAIQVATAPVQLNALVEATTKNSSELSPEQASATLGHILRITQTIEQTDSDSSALQLSAFIEVANALRVRMTPNQIANFLEHLLKALQVTTRPDVFKRLLEAASPDYA